jgi:putative NADPH-quinone reductase
MKGKKVHVVYAHPEPKSFCGSARNVVLKALKGSKLVALFEFIEEGAIVAESDLYAMNFNPVISR